jgi:hypothetical protein
MVDKQKYIQKFKELYELKNKKVISDDEALHYFENLITLVGAVHQPVPPNTKNYGDGK